MGKRAIQAATVNHEHKQVSARQRPSVTACRFHGGRCTVQLMPHAVMPDRSVRRIHSLMERFEVVPTIALLFTSQPFHALLRQ